MAAFFMSLLLRLFLAKDIIYTYKIISILIMKLAIPISRYFDAL